MIAIIPDLTTLPIMSTEISNTIDSIKYIQQIVTVPKDSKDTKHLLQHIIAVIEKEINIELKDADRNFIYINQVVLNLCFRSYFQLIERFDLIDEHFQYLYSSQLNYQNESEFQMLFAVLLTDQWKHIDVEKLKEHTCELLKEAIENPCNSLLAILKVLNLLCKKYPKLDVNLSLDYFYNCLQSNTGQFPVRDECLILFTHCCLNEERALAYFKIICEFWPWTNRNKYYLLSCIIQKNNAKKFLKLCKHSESEFFNGIRLSLYYKNLFAPSQYLIKSLCSNESEEILELSIEILTRGSMKELENFYSQWFNRITEKDKLFQLLQCRPEIIIFLADSSQIIDSTENYRLILIFSLFSRQIFILSKLHFFKISTELITNCFQFSKQTQLLIYKFIIDNLNIFSIEDCLEFIVAFIKQHKNIENSQFRNGILNKMPIVINYISKTLHKLKDATELTTLGDSITEFFQQLHQIINTEITTELYQPKIFSLKLLEILIKTLYSKNIEKNTKNCSITNNQELGSYLCEQSIFNKYEMSKKLLTLINDPLGFEDVLQLIVKLLQELSTDDVYDVDTTIAEQSKNFCKEFCQRCDIDECSLSPLYAKVALYCTQSIEQQNDIIITMYNYAQSAISDKQLLILREDPLLQFKTKYHIFGYLNVLDELVAMKEISSDINFVLLLNQSEHIVNLILEMLALNCDNEGAASFQDMDESLELLVRQSTFESVDKHEDLRKFLLMSFWLTLKSCCDLATSIGIKLIDTGERNDNNLILLKRCLHINVIVLTRCRHKGAIEAAGISIGKLTKSITSNVSIDSKEYALLHNCIDVLFDEKKHAQVSKTRRGAGFSIMFLHIVNNEVQRGRPLLKQGVNTILQRLKNSKHIITENGTDEKYDRAEALILHYLCVLVRDTELRDSMSKYYNEIILSVMCHIDNSDWTICNAALHLFGALIPKIVGQKQANEYETPIQFECSELTFSEIIGKLPIACEEILKYCKENLYKSKSTRSIILFLSFFSKVEHLRKDNNIDGANVLPFVLRFRELMWQFLSHQCDKVRQLSALCFVRAHEFHYDLPQALYGISMILFNIKNENFFYGLVCALSEGIKKLKYESKYVINENTMDLLIHEIGENILNNFKVQPFKLYTQCTFLDLLKLWPEWQVKFANIINELKKIDETTNMKCIGYDLWQNIIQE